MASIHHRIHQGHAAVAQVGPKVAYTGGRGRDIAARRPRFAGSAPESIQVRTRGGVGVAVPPQPAAMPAIFSYAPRSRVGTVPKLAPGRRAGVGLGAAPVYYIGGVNSAEVEYGGWTALDYGPASRPNARIEIPRSIAGDAAWGRALLQPTYKPKNFTPATRQFTQARSTASWAQATLPPRPLVNRPLVPSQQPAMLNRSPRKFGVGSAQRNYGLYAFGYPTQAAIAARLGVGPVAVLGGNSA